MKQAKLLFLLITALAFASCRPTARQTVDAEQPTDSTETVTSADTLRIVIIDKSISRSDSVVQARIINSQKIASDRYGITEIPETILFAPDGTILARGLRGEDIDKKLKEIFNDNK